MNLLYQNKIYALVLFSSILRSFKTRSTIVCSIKHLWQKEFSSHVSVDSHPQFYIIE